MTEEVKPSRPTEYNVLFADTFSYRHAQFRVRAGNSNRVVIQRHCHSAGELTYTLKQKKWDVIFIPGYFDKTHEMQDIIHNIASLPDELKPSLVIYHGTEDDKKCVKQLRNVGILATHIPWDFTNPTEHVRKESRDPKDFYGKQLLLVAKGDN